METTERIVEAYVRYIKGWFTLPNIRCSGQLEVDLLAVDTSRPEGIGRYHIESGVSISGGFSKLTDKPFSSEDLKTRVKQAGQRRTLGYFVERKFGDPAVLERIETYGFRRGNYKKIIVTWGWDPDLPQAAKASDVELWDFRDLLQEIAGTAGTTKAYFTDDTLRTLQLMAMAAISSHR